MAVPIISGLREGARWREARNVTGLSLVTLMGEQSFRRRTISDRSHEADSA